MLKFGHCHLLYYWSTIQWRVKKKSAFPDTPAQQQTVKGDNVNNMPQQAYCQPREYQSPTSAAQGPMYPGPTPPWDAPYEPAGDVSCLWVPPTTLDKVPQFNTVFLLLPRNPLFYKCCDSWKYNLVFILFNHQELSLKIF